MSVDANVDVVLEVVRRRAFAIAVAWPGWTRGGRDEDEALDALLRAGPRYAAVVAAAGIELGPPSDRAVLVVTARLPGDSGTEYGVPSLPLPGDEDPLGDAELGRQVAILRAAWAAFDAAVVHHADDELARGPRGGGRELAKIVLHAEDAERAYLNQLGVRPPQGPNGAVPIAEIRAATLATLRARVLGHEVENPNRVTRPWSPRRHLRRAAWHALDHAWEIEDRALPRDTVSPA